MEILRFPKRRPGRVLAVREDFLVRQTRTRSERSREVTAEIARRKGCKEEEQEDERETKSPESLRHCAELRQTPPNASAQRISARRGRSSVHRGGPGGEGGGLGAEILPMQPRASRNVPKCTEMPHLFAENAKRTQPAVVTRASRPPVRTVPARGETPVSRERVFRNVQQCSGIFSAHEKRK